MQTTVHQESLRTVQTKRYLQRYEQTVDICPEQLPLFGVAGFGTRPINIFVENISCYHDGLSDHESREIGPPSANGVVIKCSSNSAGLYFSFMLWLVVAAGAAAVVVVVVAATVTACLVALHLPIEVLLAVLLP